jgi:hypothetical protein
MTDATNFVAAERAPTPRDGSAIRTPNAFSGLTLDDLRTLATRETHWLWQGYLAARNVTLLTSQWKSGKTTLVSVLISKLKEGGTLGGQQLHAGKAAVVSEEDAGIWLGRSQTVDFGTHVRWFCRPFRGQPTGEGWLALVDSLCDLRRHEGLDLVVIDPLASFLPGRSENNATVVLGALLPLQRLAAEGVSVLILHHPRKKEAAEGQLARGSGALSGFVDILMEMHVYTRGEPTDRRRRIQAFSRHAETPAHVVLELNAAGTDYLGRGDYDERSVGDCWGALERVLGTARRKLARRDILDEWPDDSPKPTDMTLGRWLAHALDKNQVLRDGAGTKSKPYRYWVKSQEKFFGVNGLMELDLDELWS